MKEKKLDLVTHREVFEILGYLTMNPLTLEEKTSCHHPNEQDAALQAVEVRTICQP